MSFFQQQQQLLSLWSRFVFFSTRSKAECSSHPFRGKFVQLSKAHGLTHTVIPALCRAGHYTFVECRRRRNMVCATIEDTNQMANFINHSQSMTIWTTEEPRRASRAQESPDEPKRAQKTPDEPKRAHSPEEHRSVQESPEEPEESPGEPKLA